MGANFLKSIVSAIKSIFEILTQKIKLLKELGANFGDHKILVDLNVWNIPYLLNEIFV